MKKQSKPTAHQAQTIDAGRILTTQQLSDRWGGHPTPTTLAKWAEAGNGPRWFKAGGKTSRRLYALDDVVAYEAKKKAETEARKA